MAPGATQPIEEVGVEHDNHPIIFHFPASTFAPRRSPRIKLKIAQTNHSFILDTGAELSIIPSSLLEQLPPQTFTNTPRVHNVTGFAGTNVQITGPYLLPVTVCSVSFIHPFYTLASSTPCVAGYDLVCAAKLVIDPVHQLVWSTWHSDSDASQATVSPSSATCSLHTMSAQPPPTTVSIADQWLHDCYRLLGIDHPTVELPRTDTHSRPCASSSPCAPLPPLSPRAPPSSSPCAPSAPQDPQVPQQSVDQRQNAIFQVDADTTSSPLHPLDDVCSEVPEHLRVLFLATVQDNHLSHSITTGLKDLFTEHTDTFATGPTDIGFCDILEHDIDTGDNHPIKQSPRRPPFSEIGRASCRERV